MEVGCFEGLLVTNFEGVRGRRLTHNPGHGPLGNLAGETPELVEQDDVDGDDGAQEKDDDEEEAEADLCRNQWGSRRNK